MKPLKFADKDARFFNQHLQSERGGNLSANHIKLLVNDPTRAGILDALHSGLTHASPNSDVYIFISARGRAIPREHEGYIFPSDSKGDKKESTAVKISELRNLIEASKARQIFLFADVCREPADIRFENRINIRLEELSHIAKPPVAGMLASEPKKVSMEAPDLGHGVFSFFLVTGLQADEKDRKYRVQDVDANHDGIITVSEIVAWLKKQVSEHTGEVHQKPAEFGKPANLPLSDLSKKGIADRKTAPFRELTAQLAFSGQLPPGILVAQRPPAASDPEPGQFYELLRQFSDAVAAGKLRGLNSASDIIDGFKGQIPEQLRDAFAVILEDRGQRVIARYGSGDQFPISGYGGPDEPTRKLLQLDRTDFEDAELAFGLAYKLRQQANAHPILLNSLETRRLFCLGASRSFVPKETAGAITALQQSIDADKTLPEPRNLLGAIYLEAGDFGKAVDFFQLAKQYAPEWAYPRHNLALTYIELGNYNAAEQEYRGAIERTPYYPYLYYNLGLLLHRLNRLKAAEREYFRAITAFKEQIDHYQELAERWKSAGKKTEYDEAVARWRELKRNSAEAFNALGALLELQGKKPKAEEQYREALTRNPALLPARHNLALIYSLSSPDTAMDLWRQNVRIDPDFHPSRLKLGDRYLRQTKPDYVSAEREYREVLEVVATNIEARVGLADALRGQGKLNEAIQEVRKAIEDRPSESNARARSGSPEKSTNVSKADLLASPSLHEKLGDLYFEEAKRDEACIQYDLARRGLRRAKYNGDKRVLKQKLANCPEIRASASRY